MEFEPIEKIKGPCPGADEAADDMDIIERAALFAIKAHRGQRRKDGSSFILHPFEDATIVGSMTKDPEIISAALLHDTVEDTFVTPEMIKDSFGDRVYELVMLETENKRPEHPPEETWRTRKEESLESLAKTDDIAEKMLWLGDKLSNMRAFYRQFQKYGESIFERFNNKDPYEHAWYYGTVLELIGELGEYPAYDEYSRLYHAVFDRYL